MKKTAIILLILCSFFVNITASAAMILEYDGSVHNYTGAVYTLNVNGKKLTDLPLEPIIFNDRALVPVREVFEALGADVNYNTSDKSIKIAYNKSTVELQIGSPTAKVNGESKSIPDGVAPKLIAKWGESAKTMVPVRFISENVGLKVDFDSKGGSISISDGKTTSTTPTVTPNSQVKLNKVSYTEKDGIVTVTVSANGEISAISKAAVTAAGVVYTDVSDAAYTIANKTEIDTDTVSAVRFGIHGNDTRIALDTNGVKKYDVSLSADKKSVIFQISGDANSNIVKPVTTPSATAKPTTKPSSNGKKIVVLDAGHGGSDPGTNGSLMNSEELEAYYAALESTEPILATMSAGSGKKYYEKTIALSVTKKVQSILESKGISVVMTRSGDTYPELDERAEIANDAGAALFVSIHLNATTAAVTGAKGIEVYYNENNNGDDYGITSKETANLILKDVIKATGAKSRGVKSANHLVTRKSQMPANLIEIGFMNNPEELISLADDAYQNKLAQGIANGIVEALAEIVMPE